jgi:signal transduction histidine kinase
LPAVATGSDLGLLWLGRAPTLSEALAQLRVRAALAIGALRFCGWSAFLALAAWLGLVRGLPDWRGDLRLHLVGALVAGALLLALRAERTRAPTAAIGPIVDVFLVYALQADSLGRSPFPAGVAGWSLGPFVLLVLLAALTLRPRLIYATAAAAAIAEAMLQRQAGVGFGAVVASALVLLLAAACNHFAARRAERMVAQLVEDEVQARLAEQKSAELQAAQRDAELLSALLVHDMKNPLATVIMRLELAQRFITGKPEQGQLQKELQVARVQTQRLLAMVEDLLAIARLERGALRARPEPVALQPLLAGVIAEYEQLAGTLGAEVKLAADASLHAQVDRELVGRVLENLLANALRFVPPGGRVELASMREARQVAIAVRNSGPAIPAEQRPHLFQRFGAAREGGRGNAGLGLYFCRLAAEAHGGSIALEDVPGWPVSFVVRLPLEAA